MALVIGPIQKQVLKHLALNPNQNAQAVQRALGIPDKNYPSVHSALQNLHKLGLVEWRDAVSSKNVPMKLWRLTDKGVLFSVSYLDFEVNEIVEALKNYAASEREQQILTLMVETLGVELFKQFVNVYLAFKQQPEGFATVALIAQLQQELKNKTLSPEDNERIKVFFEKVMELNSKTRLLLKTLKKLGVL
jgi:hypothetical protein